MYDYISGKLPRSFVGTFPLNQDMQQTHTTRQSDPLYIPRYSSRYAQILPEYHLPKIWNNWTRLFPQHSSRNIINCNTIFFLNMKVRRLHLRTFCRPPRPGSAQNIYILYDWVFLLLYFVFLLYYYYYYYSYIYICKLYYSIICIIHIYIRKLHYICNSFAPFFS